MIVCSLAFNFIVVKINWSSLFSSVVLSVKGDMKPRGFNFY